jgi:hypothetical protein
MLPNKRFAVVIVTAVLAAVLLTAASPANPGRPTPECATIILIKAYQNLCDCTLGLANSLITSSDIRKSGSAIRSSDSVSLS